jgi:hypothetical protein
MRFTETRTIVILSCDRCDTRIDEAEGVPHGWLIAHVALSEAPMASITHELCPTCREDLGMFMLNDPTQPRCDLCGQLEEGSPFRWNGETGNHVECEQENKALIERLADILFPMNEFADTSWNGGDVCDMLAAVLDDVAPWARHRQAEGPDDAFEAYKRERERLGL